MNEAMVEFRQVTKSYQVGANQVHALRGVSYSFKRGSFCAIVGQSGSGKSTLLNLLGCLDTPSSGQYLLNGQDVSRLKDSALSRIRLMQIGFIFQSFNLIPQLTVRQNIQLPLTYLGWDKAAADHRADELAELLDLGGRSTHRPNQLSGGQQQRVAIARALANDPKLLLADEPTGNLDSATGQQVMRVLQDLNTQGKTILMVTHTPEIAQQAKFSLHMLDGQIDRVEGEA
jgi:putative ABC transport system ATP-binding protein